MSVAGKQTVREEEMAVKPGQAFRPISHGALMTRLERGPSAARFGDMGENAPDSIAAKPDGAARIPGWLERLLRIPLPVKLVGANALLLAAAAAAALLVRRHELSNGPLLTVLIVAFLAALLLNVGLVMLAVRPLRVLEKTVDTIWHGDLGARVPVSLLADRHVTRVARMFNILLDGLVADRARTRRLATELINASDKERAAISRELHDSAAQSLAALVMQLSVAVQTSDNATRDVIRARLEDARALATNTLEEVRLLAHTMHPRVLDDLGLVAALRRLARDTTDHAASYAQSSDAASIIVDVVADECSDSAIPAPAKSVLYRVAQEAVNNARRHAAPKHIEIRLRSDAGSVILEVVDDGVGFNPAAERNENAGIGLFTMRERVALVDGEFHISSRPGGGTSVLASVPVHRLSSASSDTTAI